MKIRYFHRINKIHLYEVNILDTTVKYYLPTTNIMFNNRLTYIFNWVPLIMDDFSGDKLDIISVLNR